MKKKYDPNLREAMDEIRAVMKRRNIAGHVLLASPTHAEFGLLYDIPTWSAVRFENDSEHIGIRIKASSSNPDDKGKLEATMHMLCTFQDMMVNAYGALDSLIGMVRKKVAVLHLNRVGVEPDSVPGDGQ